MAGAREWLRARRESLSSLFVSHPQQSSSLPSQALVKQSLTFKHHTPTLPILTARSPSEMEATTRQHRNTITPGGTGNTFSLTATVGTFSFILPRSSFVHWRRNLLNPNTLWPETLLLFQHVSENPLVHGKWDFADFPVPSAATFTILTARTPSEMTTPTTRQHRITITPGGTGNTFCLTATVGRFSFILPRSAFVHWRRGSLTPNTQWPEILTVCQHINESPLVHGKWDWVDFPVPSAATNGTQVSNKRRKLC